MSIIIPGMRMPDSCDNCFICNRCEGNCDISDADYLPNKRPDDCPLIELPPHGRLGDLDEMAVDESEAYMSAQLKLGDDVLTKAINEAVHAKIVRLIADTPTIIPESGGNENE